MVSHALIISQTPSYAAPQISHSASSGHPVCAYFVVGVEAIGKLLAVLVRGVFGKHLAVCGALEGLEASLALDGLSGRVLYRISILWRCWCLCYIK